MNGLQNIERFGGQLYPHNSRELTDIQAERLARRFAISHDMAATIARLAYDAGASR